MQKLVSLIRSKLASRGFLVPSVHVSRFRLQTLFIYFFISLTTLIFVRYVYALSETTKQMPTDVPFNRGVSGALAGYDNGGGVVSVLAGEVRIATSSSWMDGAYLYKKTITLKNLSGQVLTASASAQVTVNTKALFDASKLQNDCDDLRVAFIATQSANLRMQLGRSYTIASGATNCSDSTATIVTFPRMEPLGIGVSDSNYELYYGNTNAIAPSGTGYDILRADGSVAGATLVCPFNGSTTCIGQSGGVTPTTATGAIRYNGASAMSFDGVNDTVTVGDIGLNNSSVYTVEFWIKPRKFTNNTGIAVRPMFINGAYVGLDVAGNLQFQGGWFSGANLSTTVGQNVWTHFAISRNGASASLYKNGQLVTSVDNASGTLSFNSVHIGHQNNTYNVDGAFDEVRISTVARYTSNFTPQTTPFEPDANTKLLLHFDENGDDPRNTGKAIDASGNGNHGTITGAKYVGGLIGVDNSSSWSGAIGSQSYAAHSGIFIEEGTTNLITNPSFEHSTYNTNWSTNYFNYAVASATFTPSMAKRNSAGPFAAGPMVQGSTSSSFSYPSDNISWTRGTQISGDFYSNVDANQGSVVLWWTPEYSSSTQFQPLWVSNYTYHSLFYVNGNLTFAATNGASHSVSLSPVAGTTYQIVARWDTKNTIDGTNYISISINDSHTFGKTSSFTAQTPNGSNCFGLNSCASEAAQGIIEGLTVYRRPLFDGLYGVDIGNGDEINQIYNSGTGRDPTLVTGSWDVVFALPTNASTGSLTTGTGNAWSHPHSSNLLGGTNGKNGFMADGTYTNDGWNLEQPAMLKYGDTTPTFTAGLAKRNSAGPFAAGVLLQSTYDATGGDVVDIGSGTNVAGNFNQTIDKDQGSMVFWITPERVTGSRQRVVDFAAGYIEIVNGKLWVGFTGQGFAHSTTLVAGNTYFVAVRWDTKNPLNGTNRVSFTVDGTTEYFGPSLTALNGSNLSLGIGYAIESAQAIIEGLTLYRRPLFDGTYGIDVGNGDEINQIYNSGTGKDPTLVTGSWDVVFALPTNASTGNITTGTGNAWSHPHASNLLYTDATNTGGFMMNGTPATDGWSEVPWYKVGGSTGVVAAYQPIGASSLANSYVNKANPGTYDAAPGVAPTWDATNGWTFNGSTQYLNSGVVPQFNQTWSVLAKMSGSVDIYGTRWSFGARGPSGGMDYISNSGCGTAYYSNGSIIGCTGAAPFPGNSVVGIAGSNLYYNAVVIKNTSVLSEVINSYAFFVGAVDVWNAGPGGNSNAPAFGGQPQSYQALAIYNSTLSSTQISNVSSAMNGLSSSGTYLSPIAIASSEKIFAGGYKYTSSGGNQGIYRSFTATNGGDYVLRALGHSDGTCSPQIKITRADGTTEITHLNGTTTSTRTAPNVYVFTWESPAAESEQVQLINTASSGTCYWHQVEVLANSYSNPSLESWSGGVPIWYRAYSGTLTQESSIIHSGNSSAKQAGAFFDNYPNALPGVSGKFYNFGTWSQSISGGAPSVGTWSPGYWHCQYNNAICPNGYVLPTQAEWKNTNITLRAAETYTPTIMLANGYFDDLYMFQLSDVSLTVTPASLANSTEASGVRVDGGDSLTQSISTGVAASTGLVKFNFTPRHSFADAAKFGVANPVIAHVYGDATNYLKLYYQSSTILRLTGVFNGTTVNADYATPTLNAGTTYEFEISYTSGGNLVLRVNGTQRASQSGVVNFTTVPTIVYWGTDNAGGNSNPYDATYAAPSATTLSASALATNEKVFSGGYKTTNTVVSAGLYQDITTTGGADYVVRGLAHSDGTCTPRITLYDQTGGAEIGHLDGTTASTRTAPNALIFTGEMPGSGTKTLRVKLLNTSNTGTCYWHQVEILANLVNNPSVETGTGDPWIPTGWSNGGEGVGSSMASGDSTREVGIVYSGSSSIKIGANTESKAISANFPPGNIDVGTFAAHGAMIRGNGSSSLTVTSNYGGRRPLHSSVGTQALLANNSASWVHISSVFRGAGHPMNAPIIKGDTTGQDYLDDIYTYRLNDVSLTVTPANQASSTEASGLRVDGADTLTQPITGLSATSGVIKFKWTPRHDSTVFTKFGYGNSTMRIAQFGSNSDYIFIMAETTTNILIRGFFNGTVVDARWQSASFVAGTTYSFELSYVSGGSLTLKVNDTQVATNTGVVSFGTIPTTAYFGTDNSGGNQIDGTISNFVALTPTENTTSPYFKFGSKSAKLVNAGTQPDEYTISINPASTATHTLSAYVYNGTTGAVGGTVDATVAKIVFNGVAYAASSYVDQGGGWWRLAYSATTVNQAGLYGVQALAGKTIYVDGIQLEAKAYATTYADGSLDTTGKYDWTGTANNSTSTRTGEDVKYATAGNLSYTQGSIQTWVLLPTINTKAAGNFPIFSVNGQDAGHYIQIDKNFYSNNFSFYWGSTFNNVGSVTVVANKWYHLVLTHNGTIPKLYINGTEYAGSMGEALTALPTSFTVGKTYSGSADNANATISDLRIFNKALTTGEVANLYYEGLSSHASSTESDDRYDAGVKTYTSPVIDLGANGQWGDIPFDITTALHGGTVNYFTRTSADNSTWTDWSSVAGSVIASDPRRYMQWKADMSASADQSDTPVISGLTVRYIEDTTPPVNPADVALGFTSEASTSATLVSGDFANHARPKFTWEEALDAAGNGQSASGVASYRMLLSTDVNSTPSAHLADPCYVETSPTARSFVVGTSPSTCTLTDNTWYLRLQSKDNSGNVSDPSTIFVYKYDGTAPRAPASVSSTTIGYSADNAFTFFWPSANDDGQHQSGIIYYQYKTGAEDGTYSEWRSSNVAGDPLVTEVSNVEAYQQGQNFFFVRSVDLAGNVSASTTNVGVAPFYYNSDAPTAPTNLVISPQSSVDSPANNNVFTVTWDKPSSYSGEIAKYYYCVNCTPGATTMTETTAAETVNRKLEDIALATQQGKNTFYIVAEDNNVNTSTGFGNRNFEAYEHADFYTLTVAPGSPQDLSISDASSRTASLWRLTLSWKAPATGGTPARYEIFRSSDDGATYTNQGNTSTVAYTDSDLTQGKKYYYKIRAVDNAGSVSLFTSVVNLSPEGKYVEPPSAGGVPSVSTGSTTATVTWTTDRSSYGTIEYGKTSSYGSAGTETVATAKHSIKFTGLVPGTEYHYRVQSLDESALVGYDRSSAYSEDYTFTTLSTPTISKVEVSDQTLESAVITWLSANLTSADIEYGETTAYGKTLEVSVGTAEATHSVKVNDLTHSTTYHFRIKGVDVDENDIVSDDYTFQTIIFPKFTAMVLNTDQEETGTAVVLGWVSNVPTTGTLEYQPVKVDPEYAKQAKDNLSSPEVLLAMTQDELGAVPVIPVSAVKKLAQTESVLQHVERISDLEDGAIYVITVRGRDAYGNEVVSDPIRYVTGADTRPPQMKNLIFETPISGTGPEATVQIIISWETDEPSIGQVAWGEGSGSEYSQLSEKEEGMATKHVIVLRELRPTTSYHLKVISTDRMKNASESEDTVVVTPSAQEAAFDVIIKNLEDIFGFLKL